MEKAFYDTHSMELGFVPQKPDILLSTLVPHSKVLELGCYDGRLGDLLAAELGCTVDGVDISSEHLNRAKSMRKTWVFDLDKKTWPIKTRNYDYIILTDVIEHLIETDSCMENIYRLLKPGGRVIYSTPNVASFGRRLLLLFGKNPYLEVSNHQDVNLFDSTVVGHLRYFTLPTMKALALHHGFGIEKVIPTSFTGNVSIKILENLFPGLCWHIFIIARKPLGALNK